MVARTFTWLSCFEIISCPLKRLIEYKNALKARRDHGPTATVAATVLVTRSAADNDAVHEELAGIVSQLMGDNNLTAAMAAVRLFEKVHAANPRHTENKIMLLKSGLIPILVKLTSVGTSDRVRHHVCCVLSELAFQDATCCSCILKQAGLADRLGALLHPHAGRTQEDAARIVNNLAAFHEDAALVMVQCNVLLLGLASMALRDADAQHIAVGALNSLSRCGAARLELSKSGVISALHAALSIPGDTDRQAATRASAAMALANLTGDLEPLIEAADPAHRPSWTPSMESAAADLQSGGVGRFRNALEDVVELFELSVLRRQRRGVLFRPYSVLYPLHQLSRLPANRPALAALGLIPALDTFFLAAAATAVAAPDTGDGLGGGSKADREALLNERCVLLAVGIVENMAEDSNLRVALRNAGIPLALRQLHTATDRADAVNCCSCDALAFGDTARVDGVPQHALGLPAAARARVAAAADRVVGGRVAVLSGQHRRLGAGSPLMALDEAVLQVICDLL